MKLRLAAVLAISAASARILVAVELQPLTGQQQQVTFSDGMPSIMSFQQCTVLVGVLPAENKNLVLYVGAKNLTARPANLGTENIAADANRKALRIFTYERLAKRIQSSATWKGIGGAISGGLQSGVAAQPTRSNFNGEVYTPFGVQPYARFNGQATTYNPAQTAVAQSVIQEDARRQGAAIAQERDQRLAGLGDYLRTNTINPGQFYGGVVEIARPSAPSHLIVQVDFAGEHHFFDFNVKR